MADHTEGQAERWTGTCLCDECVITIPKQDPAASKLFACHCRSCQRFSGSNQMSGIILQQADMTMTGPFGRHESVSEKGNDIVRFFCLKCGSSMGSTTSGGPGTFAVYVGAFAELREFDFFIEFAIRSRFKHMHDLPDATHLWNV